MKKYFLLFIIPTFLLLFLINGEVYAQTTVPTNKQEQKAANQENRITNLKSRADQEIDRRIASLNKLISRITSMKKLTAAQISTFTGEIQTEITNLTNLKTKIDADTDLPTLQTDVKSIILSYRVYALFMPQLSIIAASDRINEMTDKLTGIATKLQARITEAQSKGKDVSTLQTAFIDMQEKITDAKTQAANAISEVTPLTPVGYPGNKSTLLNARTKIKAAMTDLQAAGQDAKTIINGLKSLRENSLSPTTFQTVTPTTITTTP